MEGKRITVLIGALNDTHVKGSRLLGYALEEEGFNVVHIGATVTQEELISAALETDAKAILVSSSNGLAELDFEGFRAKCVEAGLEDIVLYAGGNLVYGVQLRDWKDIENKFKDMGFNRAYPPAVDPSLVIKDLTDDLGKVPSSA